MDIEPSAPRSIRDQVWEAADPDGHIRAMIEATTFEQASESWVELIGRDLADEWQNLRSTGTQYQVLMEEIAAALEVLVPRGWSINLMKTEVLVDAISLIRAGKGDEGDSILAAQWEGEGAWRTKRVCDRVRSMGRGDADLEKLFRERARLLLKAKAHHEAGRYDASIPVLQAQMEGLVMDVAPGKKFFTKGTQKIDLVDPQRLVSIEAGLAALQSTYGQDVKKTQVKGSLSRHGVAHGRELAYDTRVNSAKTWSVMDALVEWALPNAYAEVERRKTERQAASAGSQDVDEHGRRVDEREFSQTRDMLRLLGNSALGWHRKLGRFRDDLVGGVYKPEDFEKRQLPAAHGTRQNAAPDGQEVIFWRRTVSGWVLGLAVTHREGAYEEHYYARGSNPSGGPSIAPEQWSTPSVYLPDWP